MRVYDGNKIKSEMSLFQLNNLDIIQNTYSKEILVFGELEINSIERSVSLNKEQVLFTSKEFEILFFLASYPGQVFTHRQIYETVWEQNISADEGNVTAHIRSYTKMKPIHEIRFYSNSARIGYKFAKK